MESNTAVAEAGTHAPAATQWVVFGCGERRFGFPLGFVTEIISPREFTRLPGAGPEVCGLIAVRGRMITVLDLGILLGARPATTLPEHRLLLLDAGARRVGAAVDDVVTVTTALLIERAAGADVPAVAGNALLGMGRDEQVAFIALDPEPLLRALL